MEINVRPMLSHSNSFGNNAEKDTAGCRAFYRKSIVIGDTIMPLPYGFMLAPDGHIAIDQEKANILRTIYRQYLSGMSLKGIADFLFAQDILSPRGKAQWTQAVISDLLSNQRYIGPIISFDEFFWHRARRVSAAILMKIPINERPPGTTRRVY